MTKTLKQLMTEEYSGPRKLCSCGCGEALEPRFDGLRHEVDGHEVNDDCYFDSIGDGIEKHPIGPHGLKSPG